MLNYFHGWRDIFPQMADRLNIVTKDGLQGLTWQNGQLTYIGQDRSRLPPVLAERFGPRATRLDLSYNSLSSLQGLNLFTNLRELVLDNNLLSDSQINFQQNLRLKTLSLNKNKLHDLYKLIKLVKISFPNLEYLSLMGNPLCPIYNRDNGTSARIQTPSDELSDSQSTSNGSSNFDYQGYRYFVIYQLPNLRFLDSYPVSTREREEALKRCYLLS